MYTRIACLVASHGRRDADGVDAKASSAAFGAAIKDPAAR